MRANNPYAPLHYYEGATMARAACPRWRVVSVVLEATLPGRAWPKQAWAMNWTPPPPGVQPDGPPAWLERDHSGAATWHEGQPPAPAGVVCDESWQPVRVTTRSGRQLPNVGRPS